MLKKYQKTAHKRRQRYRLPTVYVSASGLTFNVGAVREYFKEWRKFVELSYDSERKVIGIKRVPAKTDDSYELRFYGEDMCRVHCMGFLKDMNIFQGVQSGKSFPLGYWKEKDLLIVELEKVIHVG